MNPVLTFIVVCKGRLEHLKASLPKLIQQPKSETIVIDSNCPDGAADWVAKNYPAAKIVMLDDDNEFNLPKSRNAGLKLATTKWICFINADIIVKNDFIDQVLPLLHDRNYYTFSHRGGLSGTCIAALDSLISVCGYDEALVCWCGEDDDLYARLRLHKINSSKLPLELIESIIEHSDDARTRFYHQKDIFEARAIAELYGEIKFTAMIATQNFNISISERKRMFNFASDFINSHIRSKTASGGFTFRIPPHNAISFLTLKVEKEVTIKVNLKRLTSRPQIALAGTE
jgi:glycosyltransferase involved in cell wall biosynthesis